MEEKIITAIDAAKLTRDAKKEYDVVKWNKIMDRIKTASLMQNDSVMFDEDSLSGTNIDKLESLGYIIKEIMKCYQVSWPDKI